MRVFVSVCLHSGKPLTELSTHQRLEFSLFFPSRLRIAAAVRLTNGSEDKSTFES